MATSDFNLIGTLKKLFERCKDGEHGYHLAAKHAQQAASKHLGDYANNGLARRPHTKATRLS